MRNLSMRQALLAVVLVQSLVLGWMVWDRVSLLSSGREIRAAVVPVDPRDIFRGDYVVLGYAFSTRQDIALPAGSRLGDTVYALLKKQEAGDWSLVSITAIAPEAASESEVVVKGIIDSVRAVSKDSKELVGRVRYGIERFYVPEGTGRALEQQVRENRIVAVLAVGSNGKVALKALETDGKRVAEEPLL